MQNGPVRLFAPANVALKAGGALASAVEIVMLDLEDAVTPGTKVVARGGVGRAGDPAAVGNVVIRLNATGTPDALCDIEAAVAAGADGTMLPKAESAEDAGVAD